MKYLVIFVNIMSINPWTLVIWSSFINNLLSFEPFLIFQNNDSFGEG